MRVLSPKLQRQFDDMQSHFRRVTGVPSAELTLRGPNSFTVSAEGNHEKAFGKFVKHAPANAKARFVYDAECDFSCLYLDVDLGGK